MPMRHRYERRGPTVVAGDDGVTLDKSIESREQGGERTTFDEFCIVADGSPRR